MRNVLILAAATVSSLLSGCAAGPLNGHSSDAMQMVVAWKNPDYGQMTDKDYATVVRHANWCKKFVADKQLSSAEESELVMAATYGIANFVGVGGGSQLGGVGQVANMGPYGGVAGAATGAVGGATTHASTKAMVTGYCTGVNLSDAKSRIPGVHAMGAYVRTTNHSNKTPGWVVPAKSAPSNGADQEAGEDGNLPPLPQ